jgi:uncharacterized protein YqgC (DUF456 family)
MESAGKRQPPGIPRIGKFVPLSGACKFDILSFDVRKKSSPMDPGIQYFLLYYITAIVMLVGLIGVFVPLLPGIELVWLAALVFGILHGFGWTGAIAFGIITILFLVGLSSDIWITGLGLRAAETSLLSIGVGVLLLVAGSLLFTPIIGILLGLAGMILVEYRRHRSWRKAARSAGSAIASCLVSYGFKFGVGVVMMGIWIVWALWG